MNITPEEAPTNGRFVQPAGVTIRRGRGMGDLVPGMEGRSWSLASRFRS